MNIGFALCGSFCTFEKILPIIEDISHHHKILPILSQAAWETDSRFGTADQWISRLEAVCGRKVLHRIDQVEPIGPRELLDVLVIAPCTGNTLAKLSRGIADGPVTMAAKSHLRNGRPVVIGVSTNDGLGAAAENIGRLLVRKHIYFVPFGQDDPQKKPNSLVADFRQISQTVTAAMAGQQLQPVLL